MPFIESGPMRVRRRSSRPRVVSIGVVLLMTACAGPSDNRAPGDGAVAPRPSGTSPAPLPKTVAPSAAAESRRPLPAPAAGRNWEQVRRQAAERLVAANPDITYMGTVPDQLLAIPVLEVELNGDGSVRKISYLRQPREAKDTLLLAAAAVRRAAPFGDVSHLPKPWRFTETFLFNDDRKFKPRTLD